MQETEAEDALETARAAMEQLQGGVEQLEQNIARARSDVITAANAILAVAAERLLADALAAKQTLLRTQEALRVILDGEKGAPQFLNGVETLHRIEQRRAPLAAIKIEADQILMPPIPVADEAALAIANETQGAWRAAQQALLSDPDAPLPGD